eukprot:3242258-Prymnesium_polylepis.1
MRGLIGSAPCAVRVACRPVADGRWWRPGAVSDVTRALRCLWHEIRRPVRPRLCRDAGSRVGASST